MIPRLLLRGGCVLFLTAALVASGGVYRPNADTHVSQLRIGISAYTSASSLPIGNSDISVGFITNSVWLASARLITDGAFSVAPLKGVYAPAPGVYGNYEEAAQNAELLTASGVAATPALLDDSLFAVYTGPYENEQQAATLGFNVIPQSNERTVINANGKAALIIDNESKNAVFCAYPAGETLKVGQKAYRGYIEAYPSGGGVTAVNIIDVEQYLLAVVPAEMPPSWHIEALKAQAVAARSYAATRLDTHISQGYNFCDGVHCQLYPGAEAEVESTTAAVNATSGVMAYYDGKPINAVYCASSGGATADAESVWSEATPYLRGVSDPYETTGHEWQRTFTLAQITSLASENGHNIGAAQSVTILARSAHGRVEKMEIKGSESVITLEKEDIRLFFSKSEDGSLQSRMFGLGEVFTPNVLSVAAAPQTPPPQTADTQAYVRNTVYVLGRSGIRHTHSDDLYADIVQGLPPVRLKGEMYALGAGGAVIKLNAAAQADNGKSEPGISETPPQNVTLLHPAAEAIPGQNTLSEDPVIITGRGYGHGVGMSQHGAKGMAEAGIGYKDILAHYYTGVEIR